MQTSARVTSEIQECVLGRTNEQLRTSVVTGMEDSYYGYKRLVMLLVYMPEGRPMTNSNTPAPMVKMYNRAYKTTARTKLKHVKEMQVEFGVCDAEELAQLNASKRSDKSETPAYDSVIAQTVSKEVGQLL
jgi:hypothetical protein